MRRINMSVNKAWISSRKGLFEISRGTNGWQIHDVHFLGEPVSMTLVDARDGAVYAALNLGHFGAKLHRRDVHGAWKEIAVPQYPPQPENSKEEHAWKLGMIWALAAGGANGGKEEEGVLWAGTLPGGLFRSNDRGASWSLVRSLWDKPERLEWFGGGNDAPGIHSILVDPRDHRHVLIAVSCGGVWRTRDAGATWALAAKGMRADYMPPERAEDGAIQDPHSIQLCAADPNTVWCQHHNGMLVSRNAAESWQNIENVPLANFGFPVAAHPKDPNSAWFVPMEADQQRVPVNAALAVNRTRDGGKTFETLRDGLPQAHCYDLIYRHGLAVSNDGRALLMGSTTGNVWISENEGDRWQKLDASFPPIYAVCFGQVGQEEETD
jgi:photosystem II stability/assembly factor-like uncharacterized protein